MTHNNEFRETGKKRGLGKHKALRQLNPFFAWHAVNGCWVASNVAKEFDRLGG